MRASDFTPGREDVRGKVTSIFPVPHFKYPNRQTWKANIELDDGRKAQGTVPAAFLQTGLKPGDEVEFTALLQRGKPLDRDKMYQLVFKNPRNMKRVANES